MDDDTYEIGSELPLREKGKQIAVLRITDILDTDAGRIIVGQVVASAGNPAVGTTIRFPKDGCVGTFEPPAAPPAE